LKEINELHLFFQRFQQVAKHVGKITALLHFWPYTFKSACGVLKVCSKSFTKFYIVLFFRLLWQQLQKMEVTLLPLCQTQNSVKD